MSDDNEKALEQITALLHARLKHKIGDLPSPERLRVCVRQMVIELFPPPRVVDVEVDPDGKTVHVRLELPFQFRLDAGRESVPPP